MTSKVFQNIDINISILEWKFYAVNDLQMAISEQVSEFYQGDWESLTITHIKTTLIQTTATWA